MKIKDTFTDRLEDQAKAKQALLDKAKMKDPASDPEFAARQLARLNAARIRDEREAERRRAVQAERDRVRAERAAVAAAKAEEARLAAEQARKDAEERARRAIRTAPKPVQLGLKDLKAALEARTGAK